MKTDLFISVLVVTRDQAGILESFITEAVALLEEHYSNYEVLVLDNGSQDATEEVMLGVLQRDRCVRYRRLRRSWPEETALAAGLDTALGDYVVTLDADFDPVSELPRMVERARSGYDVVLGEDQSPPRLSVWYRGGRWVFRHLARRWLELDPRASRASLRCLSRGAVSAISRVRARRRPLCLLLAEVGLEAAFHPYHRISRSGGEPKPRFIHAVRAGLSLLIHHSVAPLRAVSLLGLFGSTASLLYSVYVLGVYLFQENVMPGWTTLSLQVSGLALVAFVMLTLLGEAMGRVLEELLDRPLYHVREDRASCIMLADPARRNVTDQATEPDWSTEDSRRAA